MNELDLFAEAIAINDPLERAALLERECAERPEVRQRLDQLLDAHFQSNALLDAPGLAQTDAFRNETVASTAPFRMAAEAEGTVIAGRYKLLQQIGEGGMGSVWMADQTEPVKRRVAVKLIRVQQGNSRTILSRFEAERQAIALMDHPHIAKLLDAGTTPDGSPFFVMELVKGVPLNEFCDAHHLTIRDRLNLFMQICSAVQHAHQKGIIHRDIKPSNILVESHDGKAVPRVIDFGLAKATSGLQLSENTLFTAFGSIMGTPLYMAPEQATFNAVDVDTRADVYALGVILYELLTGTTPITRDSMKKAALDEMLRLIREQEAPTPSSRLSTVESMPSIAANRQMEPQKLGRFMKGELDWMVMKALSKERDRRYETATGFAKDIERFLNNEPVAAGPPSASYRLRKFVKRNRGQVIAASLVLVALLAGVAGTTLGLIEARRQESLAKRQETLANERAEGERLAKQKALEAAEGERLAKLDAQEKKTLAEANEKKALTAAEEEKKAKETVEDVLGFVENKVFAAARPKGQQGGLGYDVKLADAVTAALPSIENGFPDKPLVEARLRRTIALSFLYLGRPEIALEQYEATRSLYRRVLGPDHPDTLKSMISLANSYAALGRLDDALKLREQTLVLYKAKLGPDHRETLGSMANQANSYAQFGRHDDALKLHEKTLALRKAKLGPDHPDTLNSMSALANCYAQFGRHDDALKLSEEALILQKAKLGPDHLYTLATMNNLANTYYALDRHAEALKLNEEALALKKAKLGPDHPDTLVSMSNVAVSYDALGRHDDALKLREATLVLQKAKIGPDHPNTLMSMNNLATSYYLLGRHNDALKLNEETLALRKAKLGPDDRDTLQSMSNLAISYSCLSRFDDALKLHEETLALRKAKLGPGHPDTLVSMNNVARGYFAVGRRGEAMSLLEAASALAVPKAGKNLNSKGIGAFYRTMNLFQQGKKDEARDLPTKAAAEMKPLSKDE
jgi:serine/threonine protein kinase/tetratricopeptide (TPR) repeat protein